MMVSYLPEEIDHMVRILEATAHNPTDLEVKIPGDVAQKATCDILMNFLPILRQYSNKQ